MDAGTPSATALHARINLLTHQLRSRMVNIVRLAKPPAQHHTVVDVATEQLRMDVESTALVRAAEEVMVLTRELKDLWLFGGLDTLRDRGGKGDEEDAGMEVDARVVYEFVRKVVDGRGKEEVVKKVEVVPVGEDTGMEGDIDGT